MFSYQLQLAIRSIRKTPVLCGLMVLALGLGVAAAMITYTTKYAVKKNHLMHKDDTLFFVQTDSWHAKEPFTGGVSNEMPDPISYRDAIAFMKSDIPSRKTVMAVTGGTLSVPDSQVRPVLMRGRLTTKDFFNMFEHTLIYGNSWEAAADTEMRDVMVLDEATNNKLFNGENSVGKNILFEGHLYKVIGVSRRPNGTNLESIDQSVNLGVDQFYLPFGLLEEREMSVWRRQFCPEDERDYGEGFQALKAGTCLWITHWVEFENPSAKRQYGEFIEQYINEQKEIGFYPRPTRYALSNITEKLEINGGRNAFFDIVFYFGFGFLIVCTLNSISMLLAKFMKTLPESGLRRAIGANQKTIFAQYLIESSLIGVLGGILGVALTYLGLAVLQRAFTSVPEPNGVTTFNLAQLFVPDTKIFLLTLLSAFLASIFAGLYPSWRICRAPAAQYLKQQ